MTRLLALITLATGLLTAAAAAAPSLRNTVVVTGPSIRLGDLFNEAGPRAAVEVAPAPALGGRTVLDAAWLVATAREQGLDWQPKSRFEQAIVERAGQTVPVESVVAELKQELGNRLPTGQSELTLDNSELRLFVPAGSTPAITIDGLTFDPRSGRLTAYVSASAGEVVAERVRVTGRVRRMIDMPVLSRPVAPGETIAANDIEMIALPSDRLNQTFLIAAGELIGKTPKRSIRPGEPIRPGDIQTPVVIHRGDLVTVVLQSAGLMLTAQAKALEDGVRGQAIRISNTRSGKTLDAAVSGPGTVTLSIAAPVAAARTVTTAGATARQE